MKNTLLILSVIAASLTAFTFDVLHAQQNPVAAKPAEVSKSVTAMAKPPEIGTAKLWRLVSKAQALRAQLDASEAGKAVKDAESELQAEQNALSAKCSAAGFVLGYDDDKASTTFQDVVCKVKPPEQAKTELPKVK